MKTPPTYAEAVRAIDGLTMFAAKHTLAHTRRFLTALGDPDRTYPSIHVAGTNGKGSVCAFTERVLREAGMKTALFTSPHLTDIRERMRIGGEMISEEAFARIYSRVEEVADRLEREEGLHHPSYFEYLYLMAALWFAEENVDIAVIETGLGGRLDCTNTLEKPLLTVITSISLDHMQYLGNTVPEIAGEKAGILKPGVPCVYDSADPKAAEVIAARAAELGISALPVSPEDYKVLENSGGAIDFSLFTRYDVGGPEVFTVPFAAPYQAENAALAVTALRVLRKEAPALCASLTDETIAEGLAVTSWEGRMEQILPDVYLDGAHNEDGIRRFAEAAQGIAGDRRRVLLFAAVADKDYADMIGLLAEELAPDEVFATEIAGKRRAAAEEFAEEFRRRGIGNVSSFSDVERAFREALTAKKDGLLFICGSLYLAGMMKEEIRHMESCHD